MKPGHWESVSLTVLTCLGNLGVSQNTVHYWHLLCGHLSLGGRWALNQSSEAGPVTHSDLLIADTMAQPFAGVQSPRSYVVESQRVLIRILFVF